MSKKTRAPKVDRTPTLLSVLRDEAEIVIFANAMAMIIRNQDQTFLEVDLDEFIKSIGVEPTISWRHKVIDTLKRCSFLSQTASLSGAMVSYTSVLQLAGHGADENGNPLGYFELARGWDGIDNRPFQDVAQETHIKLGDLVNEMSTVFTS